MAILETPYLMQPAFNPVVFVTDGTEFTFNVNVEGKIYDKITLSRELVGGQAKYDISSFLQSYFSNRKEKYMEKEWIFIDRRLFVVYSVAATRRSVTRGVQFKGETLDLLNSGKDCLLTLRKRMNGKMKIPVYHDFPSGVCIAYRQTYQEINIAITLPDDTTDSVSIPPTSYNIYSIEVLSGSPINAAKSITVTGSNDIGSGLDIEIEFIEQPLPEYPVYLRWINRLGGYEYWMFCGRKSFREEVKRGESYWLGGGQSIDSVATRGELAPTVDLTIACGEEQLDMDDFNLLKGIFLSPYVEIYNTDRKLFERVILNDSTTEWDTANSRGVIDIEFSTIDQPIQF